MATTAIVGEKVGMTRVWMVGPASRVGFVDVLARFGWRLHFGTGEDDPDDPTIRRPEERPVVDAGRLELTALAADPHLNARSAADRISARQARASVSS